MEFYITGEINPTLKKYVDNHIANCPNCRKKIQELKAILGKFNQSSAGANTLSQEDLQDINFMVNLSAYIDNELNSKENIKIKKATVSNPEARKKLETMYRFQNLLKASYEKTKNDYKKDWAKSVILSLSDNDGYSAVCFKRLVLLFLALIFAIIVCFCYLYF